MKKIYTQPRIETVATAPQQMLCASGGIKAQISGYKQNTGGGFTQTFAWLAGIVCSSLLMLGTACSTTNNPDRPKQQGTVSIAQNVSALDVSVDPERKTTGEGGTPLTIDTKGVNPTEVYVALFPDDGATYSFTVISGVNTYTGEATAVLNEGEFVPATGLRLVKQ
ncbi:MAG: hypothetical protein IJS00_01675 [Paludibacteraceae bacterium]|nr:hypothetical protein [Paludibacteraceae bacterium]